MKQPKVTSQNWTPRCPSRDIPIRLIRTLRGVDSASMQSSPRLSLTKIRALTGVSMQAIKTALDHFRGLYRIRYILWNYVCQFGATSIPRPPGAGPAGASP